MSFPLTIVIPTVQYSGYLDESIGSCLTSNVNAKIMVWVNDRDVDGFSQSKYFKSDDVEWGCLGAPTVPMQESWNEAIRRTSTKWCFLLSDDDLIRENFLSGIDLNELNEKQLYATTIDVIDEKSQFLRDSIRLPKQYYSRSESLDLYFDNKFHHHLSLFVFSRKMFDCCGGFSIAGYPNGYYLDTVFHGKLIAESEGMYVSPEVVFSRREFLGQASAKFYFNNVNSYFEVICNNLASNIKFKTEVLSRFKSIDDYRQSLIRHRFYVECYKLFGKTFQATIKDKLAFTYYTIMDWKLGIKFKFRIIPMIVLNIFKAKLRGVIKCYSNSAS